MESLVKFLFQPRWVIDSEGDTGLCIWGFINFIKYKYSTVITFGRLLDHPKKYI